MDGRKKEKDMDERKARNRIWMEDMDGMRDINGRTWMNEQWWKDRYGWKEGRT